MLSPTLTVFAWGELLTEGIGSWHMYIELVFPGSEVCDLADAPCAGDERPTLVLTEARCIVSTVPEGVEVVEAPDLALRGVELAEVALDLRRSTKPLLVVTRNAARLGQYLAVEAPSLDRFRVHCAGSRGAPFSARISSKGRLLAFAVAGSSPVTYPA